MNSSSRSGKKNRWWSIYQIKAAVEAQLDPDQPSDERDRLLHKLAGKIEYWQRTAQRAALSHRKRRIRQLHALAIRLAKLKKCFPQRK